MTQMYVSDQFRQRLRNLYSIEKNKKQKKNIRRIPFINPNSYILKRFKEQKQFYNVLVELRHKKMLHRFIVNPIFQTIRLQTRF